MEGVFLHTRHKIGGRVEHFLTRMNLAHVRHSLSGLKVMAWEIELPVRDISMGRFLKRVSPTTPNRGSPMGGAVWGHRSPVQCVHHLVRTSWRVSVYRDTTTCLASATTTCRRQL